MSAFLSFSQAMRPLVKAQHPKLSNTDISSVLANKWNTSSEESKRPFIEREIKERLKYHESMAKWREDEKMRILQKTEDSCSLENEIGPHIMENADDGKTNTSNDSSSLDLLLSRPTQFNIIGNPFPSISGNDLTKHYYLKTERNGHIERSAAAATVLSANNMNVFSSGRVSQYVQLPNQPTLNQMSFFNASSSSSPSSSAILSAAAGTLSSSNDRGSSESFYAFAQRGQTPLEKSRQNKFKGSSPQSEQDLTPSNVVASSSGFVAPTARPKGAKDNDMHRPCNHAVTTVSAIYDHPLPPGKLVLENASAETRSFYTRRQHEKDDSDYARTIRTLQMIRRWKMSGYSDDSDESYDST